MNAGGCYVVDKNGKKTRVEGPDLPAQEAPVEEIPPSHDEDEEADFDFDMEKED